MIDLCQICKELKEIAYTDSAGMQYCDQCSIGPTSSVARAMDFLNATIPYRVGDKVRASTGGQIFDGIGYIDDISFELKNGGSPVYPAFHVVLDEKAYPEAPDECFYTEPCLELVR